MAVNFAKLPKLVRRSSPTDENTCTTSEGEITPPADVIGSAARKRGDGCHRRRPPIRSNAQMERFQYGRRR